MNKGNPEIRRQQEAEKAAQYNSTTNLGGAGLTRKQTLLEKVQEKRISLTQQINDLTQLEKHIKNSGIIEEYDRMEQQFYSIGSEGY